MLHCGGLCNIRVGTGPFITNNSFMDTHPTQEHDDSDFGHTVPGHRSGEGSGSILPYLANSLRVNPNVEALSLARDIRIAAERKKKPAPDANANAVPAPPHRKPLKPAGE